MSKAGGITAVQFSRGLATWAGSVVENKDVSFLGWNDTLPLSDAVQIRRAGLSVAGELSFYLKAGAAQDAAEVMQRFRALFEANDVRLETADGAHPGRTGTSIRVSTRAVSTRATPNALITPRDSPRVIAATTIATTGTRFE